MAFSYLAGLEDVTTGKVLGLLLCFIGAVFVALQDTESSSINRTFIGDIVALLAAMGYGLYTTIIRMKVPDDESISMQLLLGYIGLINAILTLPALIIMVLCIL